MELLQKVSPFKTTASDFADTNPILSFYLYKYYMASAINFYRDSQDKNQKAQLQAELKQIEKQMSKMKSNAGGTLNEQVDMKEILEYTELVFAKNDHFYNDGEVTKEVAENYLTIFRLYEVVNRFGRLDDGQNKRRLYSKKKFIEIMKQIKTQQSGTSSQKSSQIKKSQFKKSQVPQQVPQPPQSKMTVKQIDQTICKSKFQPNLPKPTQVISYDKVTMQIQANKCLQNAVSELSFDRYKFAREQCLRALELLDSLAE